MLYFTGEAIEDDDNVGAMGAPGATSGGRGGLSGSSGTPQACVCVRRQPDTWGVAPWRLGSVEWEEGRSREREKRESEAARVSPAL